MRFSSQSISCELIPSRALVSRIECRQCEPVALEQLFNNLLLQILCVILCHFVFLPIVEVESERVLMREGTADEEDTALHKQVIGRLINRTIERKVDQLVETMRGGEA